MRRTEGRTAKKGLIIFVRHTLMLGCTRFRNSRQFFKGDYWGGSAHCALHSCETWCEARIMHVVVACKIQVRTGNIGLLLNFCSSSFSESSIFSSLPQVYPSQLKLLSLPCSKQYSSLDERSSCPAKRNCKLRPLAKSTLLSQET